MNLNLHVKASGVRMKANIEVMQEAMNDELFLADLREIMADFSSVDTDSLPAEYLPVPLEKD